MCSDLILTHGVLGRDGAVVGCCGGGHQEGDHGGHAGGGQGGRQHWKQDQGCDRHGLRSYFAVCRSSKFVLSMTLDRYIYVQLYNYSPGFEWSDFEGVMDNRARQVNMANNTATCKGHSFPT